MKDRNLLVGAATGDDAGVYRIDSDRALVQTTDFFTPIVDDPFSYGQIAAANALSDIYAMGGRPLTALNLIGIPTGLIALKTVNLILRGGDANARPGDLLVLTKPLGTGIITTGIKRRLTKPSLERKAIAIMARLNTVGAELAERQLVRAAVDVTGFGLLGHLSAMCRSSQVGAEITAGKLPVIGKEVFTLIEADCIPGGSRDNLAYANRFTEWDQTPEIRKILLTDAQTSGGLLLAVPQKNLEPVVEWLKRRREPCAVVIGKIVSSAKPRIRVGP